MNTEQWHFHQEHRFHCPDCLDSGYRRVVHGRTVQDAIQGTPVFFLYTCAVACPCRTGDDRFPDTQDREGRTHRYQHYDPNRHCLVESMRHADNVAALTTWLVGYRQRELDAQYADNWQPAGGQDYQSVIGFDRTGHDGF